jgi:hypothetical protein
MHAVTPYLLRSFNKYNTETKKQDYFPLSNIRGKDLLDVIHKFMEEKSTHVFDFSEEKRVYKFTDIKVDSKNRTISAFLIAGFYGVKSDILDKNTGEVRFPKTVDDAEVLKHFVLFTLPKNTSEGVALFHKSRGVGVKSLFEKLFTPYFRLALNCSLQINPYAHTEAVTEWAQNAKVKELKVKGFVGSSDIAENIAKLGECNTEFIIKPQKTQNGIRASLGSLSDFIKPEPNSAINQMIEILEGQGSKIRTVAELNGTRRTFEIGSNSKGVICDIPFAEVGEDDVLLIGGQPEYKSTRKWSLELTNDILIGVYGKKAFQIKNISIETKDRSDEFESQPELVD